MTTKMHDYQRTILDRMLGYLDELERALDAHDWAAAQVARAGVYVA